MIVDDDDEIPIAPGVRHRLCQVHRCPGASVAEV